MSSHADTIRRVFDWPMAYHSVGDLADAKQALEALLAENQRLRDALADEALMLEQSVKTLREMRGDWRELTEEFEGGYLIEQYLDSLIEDLSPDSAREALAGDAE